AGGAGLVQLAVAAARDIDRAIPFVEKFRDLRMPERLVRLVGKQVLLRDVGDIFAVGVFGEQVVEGLVLLRPDFLGDRQPPFLGIGEYRVDVEDHAAERKEAVPDDVADAELRLLLHDSLPRLAPVRLAAADKSTGSPAQSSWHTPRAPRRLRLTARGETATRSPAAGQRSFR